MKLKVLCLVMASVFLLSVFTVNIVAAQNIPQPQLATPIMVVNTPALNARSGPGPQYTVIVTLNGGSELPVLGSNSDGSWYLVATPLGAAWIDVDFVLARGDFRFVPELVIPEPQADPVSVPQTIQLPVPALSSASAGAVQAAPAPVTSAGVTTGTIAERFRILINVTAIDLRAQPREGASVINTLFPNSQTDYTLVGRTVDTRGVEWVAIVVPGIGTGWVEAAKTTLRLSGRYRPVLTVLTGPAFLASLTANPAPGVAPLQAGQEVWLLDASLGGSRVQVETANGFIGFIAPGAVQLRQGTLSDLPASAFESAVTTSDFVIPIPVPQRAQPQVIVNTAFLNVRSGPGGQFSALAVVSGGDLLEPIGIAPDSEWILVRGDFGAGWIDTEFILFRGEIDNVPIVLDAY
jgi:uncharacterized protein YraI